MIRSPYAHAKILAVDKSEALLLPGVVAVLTGSDAISDGMQPIPHLFRTPSHPPDVKLDFSGGREPFISPHYPLPADKARFVGEAVAVVVAETLATAKDAAELVRIDYEPLKPCVDAEDACLPEAPLIWSEASTNVCLEGEIGDRVSTDLAFANAAHVVKLRTAVQRVTGVPMEPRTCLASYDASTGRYTLYAGSSGAFRLKMEISTILGIDPDTLRVVTGDVGGNFGTRNSVYPEYPVLLWASKKIARPIKWTSDRGEAFLSDYQGRDLLSEAELALDKNGRFLALRGSLLSNIGAHTVSFVAIVKGSGMMTSVYRIPSAHIRARGVMTNTAPTHPLRSTGRPEAMHVIESLIELAAGELGFDPIELRRKNLVGEDDMPYRNPFGLVYDSGNYQACMERALALAEFSTFAKRREKARRKGFYRGIGVSNYIEVCTGAPRELAKVSVFGNGSVEIVIGTQASGQGHETAFAQLLVEWLCVPFESIQLRMGDTDEFEFGGGSHSGRSMRMAGIVLRAACDALITEARPTAARLLGVQEDAVEFRSGLFIALGSNSTLSLFDIASTIQGESPQESSGCLSATGDTTTSLAGFPYGAHVCEIEIDPSTGQLVIQNYVAVDDVGQAINPMILHGQAHGGIAHGVGQALMENCTTDRETGEVVAGSFMDYALPRASDLPSLVTEISEVPSPTNSLGIRAGGEGGTTPALAVISNAVADALSGIGVGRLDLPLTSGRIWEAIHGLRSSANIGNSRT
jgi:carbon-monoxide dehydrogenase large subunit